MTRVDATVVLLEAGERHGPLPADAAERIAVNFKEAVPVLSGQYPDVCAIGWITSLRTTDGALTATLELDADLARLLEGDSPWRLSPEVLVAAYSPSGAAIGPKLLCVRVVPGRLRLTRGQP